MTTKRPADYDKLNILSDKIYHYCDRLDCLLDKDERFKGMCYILDYLNIDQMGYLPFHPAELE